MLNELELTGRARTHIAQSESLKAALHRDALDAYCKLRDAALRDGIELEIVSAYRDFGAQLAIWNAKYCGKRPLYDATGQVRDHAAMSGGELIEAILCWSALPGASRHHWGSELDIIDRAAMPEGYRYQLLPHEFAAGGVFERLGNWLGENIARHGFFRPYAEFRGGVYPEPWHLSYTAISSAALPLLTVDVIGSALRESEIQGKDLVLQQLPEIHRRYIANICAPADGG